MSYPEPVTALINGFEVMIDVQLGHLAVTHDGTITWDQLQDIKNIAFGSTARAIEVYPSQFDVVNNAPLRHLWLLGNDDFAPDLLNRTDPRDTLENRFHDAWTLATQK